MVLLLQWQRWRRRRTENNGIYVIETKLLNVNKLYIGFLKFLLFVLVVYIMTHTPCVLFWLIGKCVVIHRTPHMSLRNNNYTHRVSSKKKHLHFSSHQSYGWNIIAPSYSAYRESPIYAWHTNNFLHFPRCCEWYTSHVATKSFFLCFCIDILPSSGNMTYQ